MGMQFKPRQTLHSARRAHESKVNDDLLCVCAVSASRSKGSSRMRMKQNANGGGVGFFVCLFLWHTIMEMCMICLACARVKQALGEKARSACLLSGEQSINRFTFLVRGGGGLRRWGEMHRIVTRFISRISTPFPPEYILNTFKHTHTEIFLVCFHPMLMDILVIFSIFLAL